MNTNDVISHILLKEGTEYLFCYPANLLIESCANLGIAPIMSRTERTTVNMADGYSRITNGRKIGVVVTQAGPGIENAFSGVANAYADSIPILVLPGGTSTSKSGQSPDFDAIGTYQTVTKWASLINRSDRTPELLRRAFTQMRIGRPGPVLLQTPSDISQAEVPFKEGEYQPVVKVRSSGDPETVMQAATALLNANRPIIYAGQGVLWSEASFELRELAELLELPVMTTNNGKGCFPENHPLALGVGANTMTKMASHFLRESDLVLGLGCSFTSNLASMAIPDGKTLIQVCIDEQDFNKEQFVHFPIMGDAKLVIRQLISAIKDLRGLPSVTPESNVRRLIKEIKSEWMKEWQPLLSSNETPINPYRVIFELMHLADPKETIVTHDSGHPRDQMIPFYEVTEPRGYIGWGNSTQLGYGLGLAMGAKLAAPQKLVVNLMGDAAIGMAGMDIETAVRHRIPILTLVLNNHVLSGYATNYPTAASKFGFTNLYGNYSAIAEALGANAQRIEDPSLVKRAIQKGIEATKRGQPALIEFITKEENRLSKY